VTRRLPPWLLLTLATLFWGGNFVLGRAMRGHVPPLALSFWRWVGAFLLLVPFTWRGLWAQRRLLAGAWFIILVLGIAGVGNFNTFLYIGLRDTTATNAVLLNAACPALIVAITFLSGQGRASAAQLAGIGCSLAGVAVILTQGRPGTLQDFHFNPGDVWVLAAVVSWALYTVLLGRRPAGIDPLVLLTAFMVAGIAWILPYYAWELSRGAVLHLDAPTLGAVLYVAVFPSVVAYAFWNAGVAALGPNRAGVFGNLMPVFGTILAVIFLGESFQAFHAVGIGLILAGVYLAGRSGAPRAAPPAAR
jgi:drug/metabolite transporter (DMT)-like permease